MGKSSILVLGITVAACSSESSTTFTDCKIGELTGTWRVTYTETDGTCGPLPSETASFNPGKQDPAAANCTFRTNTISADKCRADQDWTCPTTSGRGTSRWTGVTTHSTTNTLSSTLTLQLTDPSITCRSTYTVIWTRL